METAIKISGMHCRSCEMLIKDALEETKGVTNAEVDRKKGEARIEHEGLSITLLKKVINNEGYSTP